MDIFLTRQPIFDRFQRVFAYDLRFHAGFGDLYRNPDWDDASNTAITLSLLSSRLGTITCGKPGHIRFSRSMLDQELYTLFPKEHIAVELQHPGDGIPEVVSACQRLKTAGYVLVVDITGMSKPVNEIIELSDIIKTGLTSGLKGGYDAVKGPKLLAGNVNTVSLLDKARQKGFDYFQGDFYRNPDIKSGSGVPFQKLNHLLLLQEINSPDLTFEKLASIIKRDVGLSYKLMRFINSAYFGFASEVRSLRHALALLGIFSIKQWLSKETLNQLGQNKPDELVNRCVIRARFCELLTQKAGMADRSSEMFLTGLFSLLDAFLDQELAEILDNLPVSDEIKNTLLKEPSVFNDLYQLMLAYEDGRWPEVMTLAQQTGIPASELPLLYLRSLEWSQGMFHDA